jgi:D-alanyl-D-alanine carboxypeptidase (penicillin-binding protein 5/6)
MTIFLRVTAAVCLSLCLAALPAMPAAVCWAADEVPITGEAAVLMDAGSGQVLFAKAQDLRWSPASTTKTMTLLLVMEAVEQGRITMSDQVMVSDQAYRMGGSQIWLDPGERLTVKDLLLAIALQSANDACIALAEHVAGSEAAFVKLMNARAKELGCQNTRFTNCHGLHDPDHYTTALDLAIIGREAARHPRLLEMTATWQEYLRGGKTWLVNTNELVKTYQGCDGLKTGSHTQGKACLVATAKRDGLRLVAVVLGAPTSKTRFAEARALLNYGFATYKGVSLATPGEVVKRARVHAGVAERVDLVPAADAVVAVKKMEAEGLTRRIVAPDVVRAPVTRGGRVGEVQLVDKAGKVVARMDLVAAQEVKAVRYWPLVWRLFERAVGLVPAAGK